LLSESTKVISFSLGAMQLQIIRAVRYHIMSGRLVVIGTRIPVTVLWGRKRAGVAVDEIAKDYGLDSGIVQQALTHIGIRQKAA
jgi:uncharacterized protein (DUF433 family)